MYYFGVAQWCLDYNGVDAVYRARNLGLSAIQIDVGEPESEFFLGNLNLQHSYCKVAEKTGVKITGIAVNSLNYYSMNSPEGSKNARNCWDLIQVAIDAATRMNVDLVFLPSFEKGEIRSQQDLMRTAEVLRKACIYAENSEVLLATENSLGVSGNLDLLGAVGHPKLRILIDSLNPVLWGHNTSTLIKELWSYICNQIHIKDGVNGEMGNASLNTGQANLIETVKVIQELGFSGYLILENEYREQTDYLIKRDMAALQELFT